MTETLKSLAARMTTTTGPVEHTATTPATPQPAPEHAPNANYHGGVVRQAPAGSLADGARAVRVTHGDGTTTEIHRTADAAGGTSTDTRTDPDGGTTTHTWSTDGSVDRSETVSADGTRTTLDTGGGGLTELATRPDGTQVATSWDGPAGFTSTETAPDGSQVSTVVRPTATGGHYATVTGSDGTVETVRVTAYAVDNPDGSQTSVYTFPDGGTRAFTVGVDGRPVFHQAVQHDGSDATNAETRTVVGDVVQVRTIDSDGNGTRVDTATDGTPGATWSIERQPDGIWVETRLASPDDPSSAEITYEPDGRAILQEHAGDRAVETLTDPGGHTVRTTWTTSADAPAILVERVETTPQPDGSVVRAVSTTRGGPVTITTFAADGQVTASGGAPASTPEAPAGGGVPIRDTR